MRNKVPDPCIPCRCREHHHCPGAVDTCGKVRRYKENRIKVNLINYAGEQIEKYRRATNKRVKN